MEFEYMQYKMTINSFPNGLITYKARPVDYKQPDPVYIGETIAKVFQSE